MTIKQAIEMIDDYLLEPNSIAKEWVEVLRMCRKALRDLDKGDDKNAGDTYPKKC